MLQVIERIKVIVAVKVIWKLFPQKRLETLRLFESTEDDSSWQLLKGVELSKRAEDKAELFVQALEEAHHAELFRRLYREETGQSIHKYFNQKNLLYKNENDAWKLPVYCLIGEEAAANRFHNLALALPPSPLRKMLEKIVADEIGHIHKAKELIKVEGKSEKEIQVEVGKIKRSRFVEHWMRSGRNITGFVIDILLALVYLIFGGLFSLYLATKRREA